MRYFDTRFDVRVAFKELADIHKVNLNQLSEFVWERQNSRHYDIPFRRGGIDCVREYMLYDYFLMIGRV
jgi:hypothetical protein